MIVYHLAWSACCYEQMESLPDEIWVAMGVSASCWELVAGCCCLSSNEGAAVLLLAVVGCRSVMMRSSETWAAWLEMCVAKALWF